jgi:hypothetical protein
VGEVAAHSTERFLDETYEFTDAVMHDIAQKQAATVANAVGVQQEVPTPVQTPVQTQNKKK